MTRAHLPGAWGRCGGARIDTERHEMDSDVAPDADRVIAPPAPLDDSARARIRQRALYVAGLLFGVLGALLGIAHAKWVP